jgi:hypothetical protein
MIAKIKKFKKSFYPSNTCSDKREKKEKGKEFCKTGTKRTKDKSRKDETKKKSDEASV